MILGKKKQMESYTEKDPNSVARHRSFEAEMCVIGLFRNVENVIINLTADGIGSHYSIQ